MARAFLAPAPPPSPPRPSEGLELPRRAFEPGAHGGRFPSAAGSRPEAHLPQAHPGPERGAGTPCSPWVGGVGWGPRTAARRPPSAPVHPGHLHSDSHVQHPPQPKATLPHPNSSKTMKGSHRRLAVFLIVRNQSKGKPVHQWLTLAEAYWPRLWVYFTLLIHGCPGQLPPSGSSGGRWGSGPEQSHKDSIQGEVAVLQ